MYVTKLDVPCWDHLLTTLALGELVLEHWFQKVFDAKSYHICLPLPLCGCHCEPLLRKLCYMGVRS